MIRWATMIITISPTSQLGTHFLLGTMPTLHTVSSGSKVGNFAKFQLSTLINIAFIRTAVQSIQIKVLRRRYDMTIKSGSIQRMGWFGLVICLSFQPWSLSWTRPRTRTIINNNRFLWMKMDRFASFFSLDLSTSRILLM